MVKLLDATRSLLKKSLTFSIGLAAIGNSALGLESIKLPGVPALNKDGTTVIFGWSGDLWTASSDGGAAQRLTHHPAPDDNPRISKDGKYVFFNSERNGSLQVYRLPILGGIPEQITFHSEGSRLEDLHPSKPVILVSGVRDDAGRRPTRLLEKPLDPTKDEKVLFDAIGTSGRYSPDGSKIIFTRSGTQTYRKGYVGSQASRVWIYDLAGETFTEPVKHPSGCRYPIWAPDGQSFYYVTGRSGAFNLWRKKLDAGVEKPGLQITHFPNDSVFYPSFSGDGKKLAFRHLFELQLMSLEGDEASEPDPIKLYTRAALGRPESEALTLGSTNDATVTPTGLEWAFEAEGEIWTMDTVLKEPKKLTESPAQESDLHFSEDGKSLYYLKDNGVSANYWRMTKVDPKDFWWDTEEVNHKPVTYGATPKWGFKLSPDGKMISFIESPGTLWLAKPDGSEARKLLEVWDSPDYVWSPDGNWIAFAAQDENYNSDIHIIATDGKSEAVNVSRHPDSDYSPRWSPDGKILAFVGRRHSTSTDLFFVHLNRDTYFETERDGRLISARKRMASDPAYKEKPKKPGPKKEEPKKEEGLGKKILKGLGLKTEKKKEEEKAEEKPTLDLAGLHKRIQRIPMNGLGLSQLHWMPDSKNLIFQANGQIYRIAAKPSSKPSTYASASGSIVRYRENDKVYLLSRGVPSLLQKGRVTSYGFSIPFLRDRSHYQRMGYRIAWRVLRDRFYDGHLNNRDWDEVREKYELVAANAPTSRQFGRVMAMLLGELNASHMGFYPRSFPGEWSFSESWKNITPHLGFKLDEARRVTWIHPNGPADRPNSRVDVGERIIAIDGRELRSDMSLTRVLNGRMDRDIVLTLLNKDNEEREVTIRPISYGQARALAQADRLDSNQEKVEETTEGKLGYLHVARMMWDEFEKFEHHIYERGAGRDGLIIDVRDNGGGFTADHLLTVLTQPLHAYTVGRNGRIGYPQDRFVYASWDKPIVVLCNENSFSNAEIFSHAIKNLDRGKLVGIPTAGGVISTGSANILNLGRMRLPGRGWFLPGNGEDMEMYGAVPHVIIDVAPNDLPEGKDPQLDQAIEVLKKEVTERSRKLAKPIYRSQR